MRDEPHQEAILDARPGSDIDHGPPFNRRRGHRPTRAVAAVAKPVLPEREVCHDFGDRVRVGSDTPLGCRRRQVLERAGGWNVNVGVYEQLSSGHPGDSTTAADGLTGPVLARL